MSNYERIVHGHIPFGNAELVRTGDRIEVTHADDTIGVSAELWDQLEPHHKPDNETLVLDTDGQYRYRLRCWNYSGFGALWLIFDREASE